VNCCALKSDQVSVTNGALVRCAERGTNCGTNKTLRNLLRQTYGERFVGSEKCATFSSEFAHHQIMQSDRIRFATVNATHRRDHLSLCN
jgi:hypothetical protein